MPFKHNQPNRHHIPKMKYRVTNWAEYDRGLVQRGDIRFWIEEGAIEAWIAPYRTTPGGQRKFSNIAIETTLILGAVYRLPLRQAEGFVSSLMLLMGLDLPVPDHTTLARRRRTAEVEMHAPGRNAPVDLVLDSTGLKFFGAGEWARQKHGETRRSWRKLHIAMDAGTGEIMAHELTNDDTSDPEMVTPLMENAGGRIKSVFADGDYDAQPSYDAISDASPPKSKPKVIINPREPSIPDKGEAHGGNQRELHAARIAEVRQMEWQKETEYGLRSLGEVAIGRVKSLMNGQLTARTFGAQQAEVAIKVAIANKSIRAAKPVMIRVQ